MIDNGGQSTIMVTVLVAVCGVGDSLSVTVSETGYLPSVVGVPLIVPAELRVRPGGRPLELQV